MQWLRPGKIKQDRGGAPPTSPLTSAPVQKVRRLAPISLPG
jgi:hypothetical protein